MDAIKQKPVIIADRREREVLRNLDPSRALIQEKQLDIGDFILSERVGAERKRMGDFLQSITDQRIFRQAESLSSCFERPVLILEGNPDTLFLERNIHPNTIRGVLASISVDYRIPIIWTPNAQETAEQLFWIANREQVLGKRGIQLRSGRKCLTPAEQQEFLVSGLPGINSKRARKLLEKFGTPEKVFRATEKQLLKVNGFGKKTIERMNKTLTEKYPRPGQSKG